MNEQQLKWLEQIKSIAEAAIAANTVKDYEEAVDAIQKCVDECPEP